MAIGRTATSVQSTDRVTTVLLVVSDVIVEVDDVVTSVSITSIESVLIKAMVVGLTVMVVASSLGTLNEAVKEEILSGVLNEDVVMSFLPADSVGVGKTTGISCSVVVRDTALVDGRDTAS